MRLFTVDAFTDRPFGGNPAGVCLLDQPAPATWMQSVAAELRHAETAFVTAKAPGRYGLRWFTPTVEVDLCGHATLAAAHVLNRPDRITFDTRGGELSAEPAGADGIRLDFPKLNATASDVPDDLAGALRLGAGHRLLGVWRSEFDLLVEVESAAVVLGLAPDFARLAALGGRGVVVTAAAGDGDSADFVSRFFAPACGVNEDPVTGSAHCVLAPFWSARFARPVLAGRQLSAREGIVRTEVRGDRVLLTGRAVTVWSGVLSPAALPR